MLLQPYCFQEHSSRKPDEVLISYGFGIFFNICSKYLDAGSTINKYLGLRLSSLWILNVGAESLDVSALASPTNRYI